MKQPRWTRGGAAVSTTAGTLFSLLSASFGGLGVMAGLFGAWIPAVVLSGSGIALWLGGRWLIDR